MVSSSTPYTNLLIFSVIQPTKVKNNGEKTAAICNTWQQCWSIWWKKSFLLFKMTDNFWPREVRKELKCWGSWMMNSVVSMFNLNHIICLLLANARGFRSLVVLPQTFYLKEIDVGLHPLSFFFRPSLRLKITSTLRFGAYERSYTYKIYLQRDNSWYLQIVKVNATYMHTYTEV